MSYAQDGRPIRIHTPLGKDVLLLEDFTGREGLSQTFEFQVNLFSTNPSIDPVALIGKPGVLAIQLVDGSERYVHGWFNRIEQIGQGKDGLVAYSGTLVPWFWFLRLFSDCRIFQNKSIPDIIKQMFGERGFTDFDVRVSGEPRDYVVQYNETDFDFISRWMEHEGYFYYFTHSEDKHTMVIADKNSAMPACPIRDKVHYYPGESESRPEEDTINHLVRVQQAHTGKYSLDDFDFEKPNTSIDVTMPGKMPAERYDYPGFYKDRGEGERYAKIRLEEHEARFHVVQGGGNSPYFTAGHKFTLEDHYRDDTNQTYVLLTVEHAAGSNGYRTGNQAYTYLNSFTAIPFATPYRPPRITPRPYIRGEQTAIVTGKSGEEIWVDKYGRVKVQFHWDREGKYDEDSSCWIRVSQGWAGKAWGAMVIPRIGQEVLVGFLEGDPDQPVITGRVYNAEQTVPYALPDEQNKSVFKSYSTKGGGGANEIRIDDTKGEEMVFVHAERDFDLRVKRNERKFFGGNVHTIVEGGTEGAPGDLFQKIKGDEHLAVVGDQMAKIDGSASLKIGTNQDLKIGQKHAVDAGSEIHLKAGQTVVIEAGTSLTVKVGGNFININSGGIFIKGNMVMINSGGAAGSGSGSSPSPPKGPDIALTTDPGQKAAPPPPPVRPVSNYSPQALAMQKAAQSGAPFCQICAAGGA